MVFCIRCINCRGQETEHNSNRQCCGEESGMPIDPPSTWAPERPLTEGEREELDRDKVEYFDKR